jgi:hypothetical protein
MAVVATLTPERSAASSGKFETVAFPNDVFGGVIKDFFFIAEDENGTKVKDAKPNKVVVYVAINPDEVPEEVSEQYGTDIALRRKMTISTYKNAAFAKFLAAATGINVEDEAALGAIDTDDLKNAPIRVHTKHKPNHYVDIESFLPARKQRSRATSAAAPALAPAASISSQEDDFEDLPF